MFRCSSRFGIPDYQQPGGCEFFEMDGELLIGPVGNPADQRYHTFVETFAAIHYREESDTWEVIDTEGLTSIYGRSEARIGVGGRTSRWFLVEVTNSYDQSISVAYESFGNLGVLYPSEIAYGRRRVRFAYSTREDPIYEFRDGVETRSTRRMTEG